MQRLPSVGSTGGEAASRSIAVVEMLLTDCVHVNLAGEGTIRRWLSPRPVSLLRAERVTKYVGELSFLAQRTALSPPLGAHQHGHAHCTD